MSKYSSNPFYIYYPGTSVPINKLDIKDEIEIGKMEGFILYRAYERVKTELNDNTIFDKDYFINLHYRTFNDLYEFAGKLRTINITKGNIPFCQAKYIEQNLDRIFSEMAAENYLRDFKDKSKNLFAERIAYYMCELNAVHPFYEHNGRITRLYFDMIASYNGYEYINYLSDDDNAEDNKYIKASIECMSGSSELFKQIIGQGLTKII